MEQILMNQCCRLFLDTEDSISTEPSVTIPYSGQTEFVFPLDGSQEVSRLRWKPLNECVVLKLAAFEVTTERDGTVTLKPSETNALAIVGETYYFAAHDPQMVFDLSGLTGGVVLSARANVEFLQTSTKALEATLTVLSTGNQELVHRLLTRVIREC